MPCWSSSSRQGEWFRWPQQRELLELPGLSRSSSLGRLGSSGVMLFEMGVSFSRGVVGVFVLGALGVEEPIELLLVEGGMLLRPAGDGNDIVGAALAIAGLG